MVLSGKSVRTNMKKGSAGFTLVELMVSIGILVILFTISTINFSTILPNTSQSTTINSLVSDIRAQQTKAQAGNSQYGIHFESASYTLFKGTTYSSTDPSNFVVTLDPTVRLTSTGSQIVFSSGSGDVSDPPGGNENVSLTNSETNKVTVIKVNKYGATY